MIENNAEGRGDAPTNPDPRPDQPPPSGVHDLQSFAAAVYRALAEDDGTAGEGRWFFYLETDRVSCVGIPPKGTQRATLDKLIASPHVGGGHVERKSIDPTKGVKLTRDALVIEVAYQEPSAPTVLGAAPSELARARINATRHSGPPADRRAGLFSFGGKATMDHQAAINFCKDGNFQMGTAAASINQALDRCALDVSFRLVGSTDVRLITDESTRGRCVVSQVLDPPTISLLRELVGALDYYRRRCDDAEALHRSEAAELERLRAERDARPETDEPAPAQAPLPAAPEGTPMGEAEALCRRVGALVDEKDKAYGRAFDKAGVYFALLYPHGLRPEQYADALAQVRLFDKMVRIATDPDAFGESPWQDALGYCALALLRRERERAKARAGVRMPSPLPPTEAWESFRAMVDRCDAEVSASLVGMGAVKAVAAEPIDKGTVVAFDDQGRIKPAAPVTGGVVYGDSQPFVGTIADNGPKVKV